MKKKLLVLGGSQFQIPLIKKAQKKGLFVGVFDINENCIAREHADFFYRVSLKDKEEALNAARQFCPNGVTVGMVDVAVPSCAYITHSLGLPGISLKASVLASNKYEMIRAFSKAGVPHPKYQYISKDNIATTECHITYPVIVKPVDMAGSRGIFLAHNNEEFEIAIKKSSELGDSGNVIAEEYLLGPEVSVELIIKDGKAHAIQVTDKTTSGEPHFAEIGHLQPSQLNQDLLNSIKKVACSAAESLKLTNSLGHAELKITHNGPTMIEIGARQGGDGIAEQLIELSTGVSFNDIAIQIAMGESFFVPTKIEKKASCIRFITSQNGILSAINGVDEARKEKNIVEISIDGIVGHKYKDMVDNSGRVGYVISKANSADEAKEACDKAINDISISYL